MFFVSPDPVEPDFVLPTRSPYWLRVNGHWVHIEGVAPSVDVDTDRPSSTFRPMGGGRLRQIAPIGMRSWSVSSEWASPTTFRMLRLAAQFPDDVWLLDRSMAVANMIDPRDCQGIGGGETILAGGMPLLPYGVFKTVKMPVRKGVLTFVSLWSHRSGTIGSATYPGGYQVLHCPSGSVAQRAVVSFVPDADGELSMNAHDDTTGLQVTEDFLPDEWMMGERTPCLVAVEDPARTVLRMNSRAQGLGKWSCEIREVGPA